MTWDVVRVNTGCRQTEGTSFFLCSQSHKNRVKLIPQLWYLQPCCSWSVPASFIWPVHNVWILYLKQNVIFQHLEFCCFFFATCGFVMLCRAAQDLNLEIIWIWITPTCMSWFGVTVKHTSTQGCQLQSLYLDPFIFYRWQVFTTDITVNTLSKIPHTAEKATAGILHNHRKTYQ